MTEQSARESLDEISRQLDKLDSHCPGHLHFEYDCVDCADALAHTPVSISPPETGEHLFDQAPALAHPNHALLAAIALDLLEDLRWHGFGLCPSCKQSVYGTVEDCPLCHGESERPVNGAALVELLGGYFDDLRDAAGV